MERKSPRLVGLSLLAGFIAAFTVSPAHGQSPVPDPKVAGLVGKWTYRSFRNNPAPGTPVDNLLFGEGVISINSAEGGVISGTIDFGPGFEMELKGTMRDGPPIAVRFEARGVGAQNKDWLYDYDGILGYHWPQGVDQKDSLVGTVLRAQPHSNGQAPAGVTVSFIAVRQDATPAVGAAAAAPKSLMNLTAPGAAPKMGGPQERKKLKESFLRAEEENKALDLKPILPPNSLPQAPALKPLSAPQGLLLNQPQLFAPPASTGSREPSLKPLTYQSKNGRLEVNLTIDYNKQSLQIGNDVVQLRTYNGQLVGPVLRLKAGDVLVVNLQNNLPAEPEMPPGTNGHHEWNHTNLHFHGLHVAPQGTPDAESDNVLLTILPGKGQRYEVHIPKDHPAGTFWYHAHRHGSTAAQVSSGMAGALIIDRDDAVTNLDSIPEVAAAAQEIMVLQAIPYLKFPGTPGQVELFDHPSMDGEGGVTAGSSDDDMFSPNNWFKLRRYYLVNGEKIPTITVAPGEVRRLRVVMSGQREFVRLRIGRDADGRGTGKDQIKFHEIAMDGLATGMLAEREEVDLYPGYRSDLLIQPDMEAGGTYYLVDRLTSAQAPGATGADGSPERTSVIAKIIVRGSPVRMKLPEPSALAKQVLPDLPDQPGLTTRYAFYGIVIDGGVNYFVGDKSTAPDQTPVEGREFNPNQERKLPFGAIEKWEVGSRNSSGISVAHPFHIHINPFKVLKVTDLKGNDVLKQEFGGPVWRDTLAMKQGFTYTLITEYTDFAGSFVDHCHILDHEDHGMMEKVTIVKGGAAQAAPPPPPAPALRARIAGAKVPELLEPYVGGPLLVVTVRSVDCGLCQRQMAAIEKAAAGSNWPGTLQTVFVAPDAPAAVEDAIRRGLVKKAKLLADPRGNVLSFIDSTAAAQDRGHGILLMDADGKTLFKSSGQEPLLEIASLQPHLDLLVSTPPSAPLENSAATVADIGNKTEAPKVGSDALPR